MQAILEQIKQLADEGDDACRNVKAALQSLVFSFETPDDTIHRYGQMIGIDLGQFRYLAEIGEPVTVDEVSEKTGAEFQLTNILLLWEQFARPGNINNYAANHVTRNLAMKVVEAGISHYFGTAAPPYQSLPQFLQQTGYKNPVTNTHTAFHMAFRTDTDAYAWFAQNPEHLEHFNNYMALRRKSDATWLSVYPVHTEASNWPVEKAIGGRVGHQCRVVLQDMPHSVAQALPTPGVENMAHDMFEPQPVTGAKFYHLRVVLHNHPPEKIKQLLNIIKAAMGPESVLLIDEMVFPRKGAFATMERTEAQWREVFEDAGLELVRTYTYYPVNYESVMDVRLPLPA
ncbi:S-adenosyl-L-methionine-dependent methyltransferase [Xylaria grammica]|nr:S-adenosyl-L-methionine-dependent methyltransferase [Xylaria grammica]